MSASFLHAQAVLKLASLKEADWLPITTLIPSDVVVYTSDLKKFKTGDGTKRYRDLPFSASVALANTNANEFDALVKLTPLHDDQIIIAQDGKFTPSVRKVSDLNAQLITLEQKLEVRAGSISTIVDKFTSVDSSISSTHNGMVAVSTNHRISPGFKPDEMASIIFTSNPLTIRGIDFFEDIECNHLVTQLYEQTKYYVYINAQHDLVQLKDIYFNLISSNLEAIITNIRGALFEIIVPRFEAAGSLSVSASVGYETNSASFTRSVPIVPREDVLLMTFNTSEEDYLNGSTTGANDYTAIVGHSVIDVDNITPYMIRMTKDLTTAKRSKFQRSNKDKFNDIVTINNKYFVVGSTIDDSGKEVGFISRYTAVFVHELTMYMDDTLPSRFTRVLATNGGYLATIGSRGNTGSTECIVYRFTQDLEISLSKSLNRSLDDEFLDIHQHPNGAMIIVGRISDSTTNKKNGIVFKLNTVFGVMDSCIISGTYDKFITEVKGLADGTTICVGNEYSKGPTFPTYSDGFVVKLDAGLNASDQTILKITDCDDFKVVACIVGLNNNLIVIGNALRSGIREVIIITLNASLDVVSAKRIHSTYDVVLNDAIFKNGFINCSGEIIRNGTDRAALFLRFERIIDIDTLISPTIDVTITNTAVTTQNSSFVTNDTMMTLSQVDPLFISDSFTVSSITGYTQFKDIISI
jgi:hypothetical protein